MSLKSSLQLFFKSNVFFVGVLVAFVVSCVFVATITKFDVPHDESYHFALIKRFVHEADPFINEFVSGDDFFGDIQRNPSIMYHYIMSKPLYVAEKITQNEYYQILFLRIVNIFIATTSLVVVRKLAIKLTKSEAIANLATGMTAFSTIFVFISSSVSYDNLFVLIFLISFYFAVDLIQNKEKLGPLIILLVVCLFGTLVKQTFLIFGFLYLLFFGVFFSKNILTFLRSPGISFRKNIRVINNFIRMNKLLVIVVLVLAGLFIERYGINIHRYGTPLPDCSQVHTLDSCNKWPAYARNTKLKQTLDTRSITMNYLGYANYWINEMRGRTNGIYTGWDVKHDTLLVRIFMLTTPIITIYLIIINYKKYRKIKWIILAIFMVIAFGAILLKHNYSAYVTYRYPVAVQARYIMPILPIIYILTIFVINNSLKTKLKQSIFYVIVTMCFLTSGVVSYIQLTSGPWYRAGDRTNLIVKIAKKAVKPLNVLIIKAD